MPTKGFGPISSIPGITRRWLKVSPITTNSVRFFLTFSVTVVSILLLLLLLLLSFYVYIYINMSLSPSYMCLVSSLLLITSEKKLLLDCLLVTRDAQDTFYLFYAHCTLDSLFSFWPKVPSCFNRFGPSQQHPTAV